MDIIRFAAQSLLDRNGEWARTTNLRYADP